MTTVKRPLSGMDFIEVSLEAPFGVLSRRTVIRRFLASQGFAPAGIAVFEFKRTIRFCVYLRSAAKVRRMSDAFAMLSVRGIRMRTKVLARREWLDKWKRSYHTLPLGKRLAVVPVWEKARFAMKGRLPVYLDPGGAFGSGGHETTRLVIRLMEPLAGRFRSFFDIGTGTGILSVAAGRLGAREIFGIDSDGPSVKTAQRNFAMNGLARGRFARALLEKVRSGRRYDLVAANLVSGVLAANRLRLLRFVGRGGFLIASGVLKRDASGFRKRFEGGVWRCRTILKGRHWAAFLYARRSAPTRAGTGLDSKKKGRCHGRKSA